MRVGGSRSLQLSSGLKSWFCHLPSVQTPVSDLATWSLSLYSYKEDNRMISVEFFYLRINRDNAWCPYLEVTYNLPSLSSQHVCQAGLPPASLTPSTGSSSHCDSASVFSLFLHIPPWNLCILFYLECSYPDLSFSGSLTSNELSFKCDLFRENLSDALLKIPPLPSLPPPLLLSSHT